MKFSVVMPKYFVYGSAKGVSRVMKCAKVVKNIHRSVSPANFFKNNFQLMRGQYVTV